MRPAASIRRAAAFTASAAETFSEFPISPTRLILSAKPFNQHQELFVAGRAKDRGVGDAQPPQGRAGSDKLIQLAQYAIVNRRVTNHAGAPICLGLASFELRFD